MIKEFKDEYKFLSNFYILPNALNIQGVLYISVEHAFQAAKTVDPTERRRIAALPKPGQAKRAGRHVFLRSDWEKIKLPMMESLVRQKFRRNAELLARLLRTGEKKLVEGNWWHDNFWGNCNCVERLKCQREGINNLGRILMKLRRDFLEQSNEFVERALNGDI